MISGGVAFYDAKLTENYCGCTDVDGKPVTDCPPARIRRTRHRRSRDGPEAPDGTRLPVTPEFKGNLIARYTFDIGSFEAFVQGALVHVGERTSDLRLARTRASSATWTSYTVVDFSAGISRDNWSLTSTSTTCSTSAPRSPASPTAPKPSAAPRGVVPEYPNGQVYTVTNQPRTFGISWSQEF